MVRGVEVQIQLVPHPHMVGKSWEGYFRSEESQIHTSAPTPPRVLVPGRLKSLIDIRGGTELSGISVRVWGQLSLRQRCSKRPLFCSSSEPCPTKLQRQQLVAISETPSSWLTLFAPPCWYPNALPHWTFRPTQASRGFSIQVACLGPYFRFF